MSAKMKLAACLLTMCVLAVSTRAAQVTKRTWTFDPETTGQLARGFINEVGEWTVVASDSGKALAQTAKNAGPVFNVALVSDTSARDVDLSVRMKAVAGEIDQGGGLVWRARDAKNYYVTRYNPLEDNYRVYKVENGKRTQLQSADISHEGGWHTLRVTMVGDHIQCYYDNKKYIDVNDSTFAAAGKIGLWSKADAQSEFDDLMLIEQ
jgi:3-keto-disaccharide hydrolase